VAFTCELRSRTPAAETTQLSYSPEGLLAAFTTPRNHTSTFQYDAPGRLIRDDDPAGGFTTLARTPTATGYLVTKTTREGRVTTYRVETDTARTETRTNTFPTGGSPPPYRSRATAAARPRCRTA
jgi:YD repeat-containing protein